MMTAVFAAQLPQKNIIVSYDDNVPDSVMDQAMDAIKSAGGMITHEYKLIKSVSKIRSVSSLQLLIDATGASQPRLQPKYSRQFKPGETIITLLSKRIKWSPLSEEIRRLFVVWS